MTIQSHIGVNNGISFEFKIITIVPYNINSQQRDLIEQLSWTLTGTENGQSATRGGAVMYDIAQGVAEDNNFLAIDSITNSTLQTWVETEYGDKINAIKQEITDEINNRPEDFNIRRISNGKH